MSLPSPYLASNNELVLLSKGVPETRTFQRREEFSVSFFVNDRIVFTSDWRVINNGHLPEVHSHVFASRNDRIRALFRFRSWNRGIPNVALLPAVVKRSYLLKAGRVRLTMAGSKGANPPIVRKARGRVNLIRKGKVARRKGSFPRSSTLRPSPETYSKADSDITEGNNGGYFLNISPSSYVRYTRVWSGVRTPGFGKTKKKNLPVNPHNVRITEVTDSPGIFLNQIPSTGIFFNRFRRHTLMYPAPPDSAVHLGEAQFKALRKLIERANANIDANLAQDFAQIGQTVKLISHSAKSITQSLLALKSGNIPGAVKALWSGPRPRFNGKGPTIGQSLANNWLQLQYGWKPLLQDIHGSMEALARLNVASPWIQRVTASATVDLLQESNIAHRLNASIPAGKHYMYTVSTCKYMIRYKIDDHLKSFLQQTGFTNPVNLLWEIVPFSFVVDWFTPIGPFLETLSSWDGLAFIDGSVVLHTREMANSVVSYAGTIPTAPGQLFEDKSRYSRQTTLVSRSKLTAFPSAYMPSGFKNGLASVTHATNALALLTSAFRR
jgi:hypothetical protein